MDVNNPLIEWYIQIHRFHRLVQRKRCSGMAQTTRLDHWHHVFIERRRDLDRRTIAHRPHRLNHRTEPSELHRRREMDHLIRTLFVSDSRMTCGEIRRFDSFQSDGVLLLNVAEFLLKIEHVFRALCLWDSIKVPDLDMDDYDTCGCSLSTR